MTCLTDYHANSLDFNEYTITTNNFGKHFPNSHMPENFYVRDTVIESIEVSPESDPHLSVIWLHGLGADGHDFEPVVPYLCIPGNCSVRFVFPHAPIRPVTINGGMRMRAWYDLANSAVGEGVEDRAGMDNSMEIVRELIRRENHSGIETNRIVLAGFSQGGAIALYAGLRHPEPLAGILAISTYLPLADTTQQERHTANNSVSILYLHGTQDPVIPFASAERSRRRLLELGYRVEWRSYMIPHSVSQEEISDIGLWLTRACNSAANCD